MQQLNRELEDTNRGVVALYAELDERADHLRRADELKSRFLSNMSHEFRTPLNSILALSRLLLARSDGELTPEQEKQVHFIRKAAENLTELVNDLLDLAKVEAGKTVVTPVEFAVADLFGALRGMLRPLLVGDAVALVFEDAAGHAAELYTDEGKVSQILRNFISNAIKFTERGEVRVWARADDRRPTPSPSRCATPASASPRIRYRRDLAGIRPGAPTRCRARSRAPAWACRCRRSSRSCWAAASRVESAARAGIGLLADRAACLSATARDASDRGGAVAARSRPRADARPSRTIPPMPSPSSARSPVPRYQALAGAQHRRTPSARSSASRRRRSCSTSCSPARKLALPDRAEAAPADRAHPRHRHLVAPGRAQGAQPRRRRLSQQADRAADAGAGARRADGRAIRHQGPGRSTTRRCRAISCVNCCRAAPLR